MAGKLNGPVAWVYPAGRGQYTVTFTQKGQQFDEAGPFDDELEACEAAKRGADDVRYPDAHRAPRNLSTRRDAE